MVAASITYGCSLYHLWLQEGRPFSEVVLTAKGIGFRKPDPRDDLGGVDVARKALILARCLGMQLELDQVRLRRD